MSMVQPPQSTIAIIYFSVKLSSASSQIWKKQAMGSETLYI